MYESSHLCYIGCEDVLPRMDELSSLVLYGLDHLWVTVPCRHNADSCKHSVVGLVITQREKRKTDGPLMRKTSVTDTITQGSSPHLPPCQGASVHLWCRCRCPEPSQQQNPAPPAKPFRICDVVLEVKI